MKSILIGLVGSSVSALAASTAARWSLMKSGAREK